MAVMLWWVTRVALLAITLAACPSAHAQVAVSHIREGDLNQTIQFAVERINALRGNGPAWRFHKVVSQDVRRTRHSMLEQQEVRKQVMMINPQTGSYEPTVVMSMEAVKVNKLIDISTRLSLLLLPVDCCAADVNPQDVATMFNVTVSCDSENLCALTKLQHKSDGRRSEHSLSRHHRLPADVMALVDEEDDDDDDRSDRTDGEALPTKIALNEDGLGATVHAAGSTAHRKPIRVLSANLWNFNHWEHRLGLLQAEFGRLQPDVIGFQEVRARRVTPRKPGEAQRFQVTDLARLLPGYQFAFQPAMTFNEGQAEVHSEGLAVFSRFPIVRTLYFNLSRDGRDSGDFHQRICLAAIVQAPEGKLFALLNTHLSLSAKARARSFVELGNIAREVALSARALLAEAGHRHQAGHLESAMDDDAFVAQFPVVLVGDFNAVLQSDDAVFSKYQFTDPWTKLHPHENGFTFSSWEPRSRIDYTLVRGAVQPLNITIEGKMPQARRGLAPIGGVQDMQGLLYPSDHFFLALDVRLGSASGGALTL